VTYGNYETEIAHGPMMIRWRLLLLLFCLLCFSTLSSAASSTTFCKCTCFAESKIIELDGQTSSASSVDSSGTYATCTDCTKKFCLDYHLPICKDATESDVFTTCFQRDSAKDEAVVFIFIFATVGLLIYAAVQPFVQKWVGAMRERRSYAPVSNGSVEES